MPLVTGADFGLRFPQGNRNDISPIVNALGGMIQEEKQSRLAQQKQQAETLQQAYKATALDLLGIAKKPGLTAKRGAIIDMAKRAKLRGEDTSILSDLLTYTTDDELNTAILGIAHRAGEQDKMLTEAMKAAEPVEQFEPIYQDGQIIAQRNVSTNKVIDDPRAKASQHARNIGKFFQPLTISNAETGEKRLVMPVGDPTTGTAKLADVDLPQGFEISKETPEEQRAADQLAAVETSAKQITAKGKASRGQQDINKGITAADSMPNLNRGLELLEKVDTGGAAAASLWLSQTFGVETPDEAELSNRLGKAVVSQLRETFGAAFTVREMLELKRIEGGFSKSTPGNIRLLKQAIKIARHTADRGINAAIEAEDYGAAQKIKDAMEFRLGDEEPAKINLDDMTYEELLQLKAQKEANQ